MIKCIVATHGNMGAALIDTTGKIIGPVENVSVMSNEKLSIKDFTEKLDLLVREWEEHDILIMVDFFGGSCWHAAQVVKRKKQNVALITGVNLPMLLAFLNKRNSYRLPELVDYLIESSCKGIEGVVGE